MRLTAPRSVRTDVRTMIFVMLAAGCGSSTPTASQACERFAQLCHATDTVAECRRDLTDLRGEMDGGAYDKMLSCAGSAGTCGEWLGCLLGGVGEADPHAKRQLDGLGKGLHRRPRDDIAPRARDGELPPECVRFDELCDPDETLVRKACTKMVRNIRSDPASLGKLAACFAGAKNCYALDNCVDDLWLELN